MPDSVVGELLCGSWGDDATDAVWRLVRDRWPLLLAALAALITIRVLWALWRRRVWRRHATGARWLEITPPVTATPAATVGLWRLLATVLPAPRRWALRPARLVWEVAADPDGMRCGLWLPPGVNPTAVLRLLHRAWPGARAEQTRPPAVPTTGAVAALAVWPTQPDWLPLVEDPSPPTRRGTDAGAPEEDRLRAVYGGLASAGRTGGALLQVHLGRAPAHRLRLLRRAMTNPERARRPRGTARAAGLLADGLRALILGVLNIVTPGPSSTRRRTSPTDPYVAELARQARAKYADAPHLLIAMHTVAVGPTKPAARAAAADVSSGFSLLSAHVTRRRLRRGAVADRWVPEARMSLVSVTEAAALAGLPAEPAAHGLPSAASRRRAATRDVFRTSGRQTHPRTTAPAQPDATGADDSPTVWSAP
ncbi:hypothetical protein [Micromonospora sp. WMMD1082]|uniref:hypothetical protein n=1 Tax=Micromonospora sp. WMMD1082 TaxID=3016104 RepID=UPI0024180884|nr:hypothetical protein [Micromonospora sp. WMMD1082]MDG4793525.1 hypothetical protein [Micromonospora sp. WMMD1082]